MRTESELREAMDELADTARSPEVVATRIAARRRRQLNPRGAGSILLAAAAVVAVAAIATPLVLSARNGSGAGTSAAGAPEGAPPTWTIRHSLDLPADWRIRIRRVTPAAEITILSSPAASTMPTKQCQLTVLRNGTASPPPGPSVEINDGTGVLVTAKNKTTVHWTLSDGAQASMSCPDRASAVQLAEAVNDEPFTITLPYVFRAFPDDYRPASVTHETGGDQTTTTVTLTSSAGAPDITVTASSLGFDLDSLPGERSTQADNDVLVTPDGEVLTNAGGKGISIQLADGQRITSQQRGETLLGVAGQLDLGSGDQDADTALTP